MSPSSEAPSLNCCRRWQANKDFTKYRRKEGEKNEMDQANSICGRGFRA